MTHTDPMTAPDAPYPAEVMELGPEDPALPPFSVTYRRRDDGIWEAHGQANGTGRIRQMALLASSLHAIMANYHTATPAGPFIEDFLNRLGAIVASLNKAADGLD